MFIPSTILKEIQFQTLLTWFLKLSQHKSLLVPDAEDALTSNAGWDTIKHKEFLTEIIQEFKQNDIRTSVFLDPTLKQVEGAKAIGADRIELIH